MSFGKGQVGRAVPRKTGEATLEFLQATVLPAFPEGTIYLVWGQPECAQEGTPLVGTETGAREVCLDTDECLLAEPNRSLVLRPGAHRSTQHLPTNSG